MACRASGESGLMTGIMGIDFLVAVGVGVVAAVTLLLLLPWLRLLDAVVVDVEVGMVPFATAMAAAVVEEESDLEGLGGMMTLEVDDEFEAFNKLSEFLLFKVSPLLLLLLLLLLPPPNPNNLLVTEFVDVLLGDVISGC